MGTQLYDKNGQDPLYPFAKSEDVFSSAMVGKPTVEDVLDYLIDKVHESDQQAVTSIVPDIKFASTNLSTVDNVKSMDPYLNWVENFIPPTIEKPYTWKRTIWIVGGREGNPKYEISATTLLERTETIYLTTNDDLNNVTLPEIDEEGNVILGKWDYKPRSISASEPTMYISTRKMENGEWQAFTTPACIGKYALSSKLVTRYCVSDDVPSLNIQQDEPEGWLLSVPVDLTSGKIWMATANMVGGTIIADENGNKWSGPNLISIIK